MTDSLIKPTPKPLKVTLLDGPRYPLETLWVVWEQSRHNRPLPTPERLHLMLWGPEVSVFPALETERTELFAGYGWKSSDEARQEFNRTVAMLFGEDIPVTENITFVFLIENMPISLREQMVRHRIGTKMGPRLGADIAPDLAESSWWSQTTRVLNLSNFYTDGDFYVPEALEGKWLYEDSAHGKHPVIKATEIYFNAMRQIEKAYQSLLACGVHPEDARQVIPLGMTHRITWEVNLKALRHIIGKRTCWIAQRGIWEDFIQQAVRQLAEQVHPAFGALVNPPCIKKNEWKSCPFEGINEERIEGRDGFPPCPLWLFHRSGHAMSYSYDLELNDRLPAWRHLSGATPTYQESDTRSPIGVWCTNRPEELKMMNRQRIEFRKFWGRNVDTGECVENQAEEEAGEAGLTADEYR